MLMLGIYCKTCYFNWKDFRSTKSGNLDFINSLSQWVLKEIGVLRVKNVKHHKMNEIKPPSEYTIMENVVRFF